jgi:hypothetical protein
MTLGGGQERTHHCLHLHHHCCGCLPLPEQPLLQPPVP